MNKKGLELEKNLNPAIAKGKYLRASFKEPKCHISDVVRELLAQIDYNKCIGNPFGNAMLQERLLEKYKTVLILPSLSSLQTYKPNLLDVWVKSDLIVAKKNEPFELLCYYNECCGFFKAFNIELERVYFGAAFADRMDINVIPLMPFIEFHTEVYETMNSILSEILYNEGFNIGRWF